MRASYELYAAGQFVLRWFIRPYSFASQAVPAAVALMVVVASAVAAPYDAWQYKSTITINNTLQPTTLTDFPVLVKLTNLRTNNYAGFNAGGSDLRFSMAGTPLSYQIESYNSAGDSYVWVKVPSIAASSNVPITAHWGNSVATAPGFTDTWSNNYGGVWHMNESTGNAIDSTTNGNNGTLSGTVTRPVTGQIDGATQTGGTGSFNVAASSSLGIGAGGTLEGWVSLPVWNVGTESAILSDLIHFGSSNSLYLSVHDGVGIHFRYGGGAAQPTNKYLNYGTSDSFANNSLHYVAATWNQVGADTQLRLYVDGALVDSDTATGLQFNVASQQWGLGRRFGATEYAAGVLDELRISSTARSSDWVKAQNLSMNDTYSSYGSISQVGPVITPSTGFGIAWTGTDGAHFSATTPTVPNNLALASSGATAFADSQYGGVHTIADLNNGLYGNTNSWLSAGGGDSFAGVDLPGTNGWYVYSIAWGRDNGLDQVSGDGAGSSGGTGQYTDRAAGLYTLQYTLLDGANAATLDTGNAATGWSTIGTLNYDGNDDTVLGSLFTMYYRHEYDVRLNGSPIFARGIRLISPDGNAIDELEVYGSLVPEPSSAILALSALALLFYRGGRRSLRRNASDCGPNL